jgi:hypothetical protein
MSISSVPCGSSTGFVKGSPLSGIGVYALSPFPSRRLPPAIASSAGSADSLSGSAIPAIEHIALTEKMMRKSELVLSKDSMVLPESSIDAYRKWEEQKKRQIFKVPIQKAILTEGDVMGPMICNFVPSQT